MKKIRNFAIIAHIDHGKSTIADRLIEKGGEVARGQKMEQVLDGMDIEQERGITIKAQTCRLEYKDYQLNLIDTPGHVDFAYEVSRSLAACEGSILVIDASKGIEAQTVANLEKALEHNHTIIPVINKIDLPHVNIENTLEQIEDLLEIDTSCYVPVSGKTGEGISKLFEAIINHLPAPTTSSTEDCKAMWIDSWYDTYLGITILVRIIDGQIKQKDRLYMVNNKKTFVVDEIGIFTPIKKMTESLEAGEIGFITTHNKQIDGCYVGETLVKEGNTTSTPLNDFKPRNPLVFCSFFPKENDHLLKLEDSLKKLNLNDRSFTFVSERSKTLGMGFKCGFLGLLHLEITKERLLREFDIEIITTLPGVSYKIIRENNEIIEISHASDLPQGKIKEFQEPMIQGVIFTPYDYIGEVIQLCEKKRGKQTEIVYSGNKAKVIYKFPLSEILIDFYDQLKSISRGYASFNYSLEGYEANKLVKLDILLNGEIVHILSLIVHRDHAEPFGRKMCLQLKEILPRQQFVVAIQAAIENKIIARETLAAFRKDVTAKCYGGDITRKKKLLTKQKEGKKKMRSLGKINIPHDAFVKIMKIDKLK